MSENKLQSLQQNAAQDFDAIEYLRCLAAGKPFETVYTIFGNIDITFRELSLQDLQLIAEAERSRGVDRKQAEVFASIAQFNNKLQHKLNVFKSISELSKSTQDVVSQLVRWFRENVVTTASVYSAIENAYNDFKSRIDKLVSRASDPDFFEGISQQGQ